MLIILGFCNDICVSFLRFRLNRNIHIKTRRPFSKSTKNADLAEGTHEN